MSVQQGAAWNDTTLALHQVSVMLSAITEKVTMLEAKIGLAPASSDNHEAGTPQEDEPQRMPWVWVSGETMPYRQLLREAGGRWSRKRQSWYFMNCAELPEHLRNLPGIDITVTY